MRIFDALGRAVDLHGPPRRIVSLVPSITELLATLGLDEAVVGLTKFCTEPQDWRRRKTVVGGTKDATVERVLACQPDLVIANKEENIRSVVLALAEEVPVYVTDVSTVPEAIEMVREVGVLTDRAAQARALANDLSEGFARLAQRAAEWPLLPVAYLIWRQPWMAVGGDTFIHDVLARAGLVNVLADRERYPEIDLAELAALGAQVILLSSEPFPFGPAHVIEVEACVKGPVAHCVDGALFSWYGSRILHTPDSLIALRAKLAERHTWSLS